MKQNTTKQIIFILRRVTSVCWVCVCVFVRTFLLFIIIFMALFFSIACFFLQTFFLFIKIRFDKILKIGLYKI